MFLSIKFFSTIKKSIFLSSQFLEITEQNSSSFDDSGLLNDLENMGFYSVKRTNQQTPTKSNSFSKSYQQSNSLFSEKSQNSKTESLKTPAYSGEYDPSPKRKGKRPPKITNNSERNMPKKQPFQNQNSMKQSHARQNRKENPFPFRKPPPIPKNQIHTLSPKRQKDSFRPQQQEYEQYENENSKNTNKYGNSSRNRSNSYRSQQKNTYRAEDSRRRKRTESEADFYDNKSPKTRKRSNSISTPDKYQLVHHESPILTQGLKKLEENVNAYLDMQFNILKQDFLHTLEQNIETNPVIDDMVDIFCEEIIEELEDELQSLTLHFISKNKENKSNKIDFETVLLPYDNQFIALFNKTAQVTHIKQLFDENKNILRTKSILGTYKEHIPSFYETFIRELKIAQEEKRIAQDYAQETDEFKHLKRKIRKYKLRCHFYESYLKACERECKIYEQKIKHFFDETTRFSEFESKQQQVHEIDLNKELRECIDLMNEKMERIQDQQAKIGVFETLSHLLISSG